MDLVKGCLAQKCNRLDVRELQRPRKGVEVDKAAAWALELFAKAAELLPQLAGNEKSVAFGNGLEPAGARRLGQDRDVEKAVPVFSPTAAFEKLVLGRLIVTLEYA